MFIQTTATTKITKLKKRIRAVSGGTSASKTISIIMWLIGYAQHPEVKNELISIVSETMPHLKRGAMRDFLNIMQQHGYYQEANWNKSDFIYSFPNGNRIEFFSADMPSKVRGPRRDVLFINEANNVPYETFTQLEIRTKKIIFLDWNPVSEFWFYKDENNRDNIIARPDCDFITLTYRDNEALDPAIVKTIEARKGNKNWWRVYGEGLLGEAEGRIYTGWELVDDIPHEARLERYGLDFGYSNDPTALIAIYYYNGGYILDEILYQKGMSNKQIADAIVNQGTSAIIYADSAEPKSIDEIKTYGVPILPANKGQGSVLQGIQFVQNQQISVTKRSLNIIREYRNYLWDKDKHTEQALNKPVDDFNHCFIGSTKVRTNKGDIPIKHIKVGDKVLTTKGFRQVLLKHNNGKKQVNKYRLHLDTGVVELICTPEHKVKTSEGWTPISQLKSGTTIYHIKSLGGKSTGCTQESGISQGVAEKCTKLFGVITRGFVQKVITYTTKMVTVGITILKTLSCKRSTHTYLSTLKNDIRETQIGQKDFNPRGVKKLKLGTHLQKALLGTRNTVRGRGKEGNNIRKFVKFVKRSTLPTDQKYQDFAITTAKLRHLEVEEGKKEKVYDLTVDKVHEYFANNILVHNCMDAIRYGFSTDIAKGVQDQEQPVHNNFSRYSDIF